MPILFGILAAIILAISAWMGYKNNDEYKKQITLRHKEEGFKKELTQDKKDLEDKISREKSETDKLIAENKQLKIKLENVIAEVADAKQEIADKKRKIRDLKAEVAKADEALKDLPDIDTIVPKIKAMRNDIATLKDDIETETAHLNNLKQQKKDTEAAIAVNQARVELETVGKSQPYLKTSIKTVYSTWGFVTLNGGDIQGVVPDSLLDVVRDGEVIAQLRVTSVEPNRAAADIIRESLAEGVFLSSGDKVVAHKEAKKATAKPKK